MPLIGVRLGLLLVTGFVRYVCLASQFWAGLVSFSFPLFFLSFLSFLFLLSSSSHRRRLLCSFQACQSCRG